MPEPTPTPTPNADDLVRLRAGIAGHCKNCGNDPDLYESINAMLTLKRTSADFENFGAGYFKQYDLSPGRFNVLMALYGSANHTLTLSDLGDYLIVTRANITGLVDGLVEDGLLRRIDHPDDRRVVLAQLTDKATKFLDWFVPQHLKNVKTLMSAFTTEEKRQFVELLDRLRAQMRRLGSFKAAQPTGTEGS